MFETVGFGVRCPQSRHFLIAFRRPMNPGVRARPFDNPPLFLSAPKATQNRRGGGQRPPLRSSPAGRDALASPHSCANEPRTRRVSAVFLYHPAKRPLLGAKEPAGRRATHFQHHTGAVRRFCSSSANACARTTGAENP